MDRAELVLGVKKQAELIERAELDGYDDTVTELLVSLRKLLNDQPELEAGSAICEPKIASQWWAKKK